MDKKINVNVDPEIAGGKYSNLVIISHSGSEFILDFVQNMPGMEMAQVISRIILTPDHAKRLLRALAENISNFESQYGEIAVTKGTYVVPGGDAQA